MTARSTRTVSWILVSVSFAGLIYINYQIATRYLKADGKTQALFGIVEYLEFQHRYLILVPALCAVVLRVRPGWKDHFTIYDFLAVLIALFSIVGTLTASWRLSI